MLIQGGLASIRKESDKIKRLRFGDKARRKCWMGRQMTFGWIFWPYANYLARTVRRRNWIRFCH